MRSKTELRWPMATGQSKALFILVFVFIFKETHRMWSSRSVICLWILIIVFAYSHSAFNPIHKLYYLLDISGEMCPFSFFLVTKAEENRTLSQSKNTEKILPKKKKQYKEFTIIIIIIRECEDEKHWTLNIHFSHTFVFLLLPLLWIFGKKREISKISYSFFFFRLYGLSIWMRTIVM